MPEHLRMLPFTLADLRQIASEQRLYAVLDACDEPAIQAKVTELGPSQALCLYRGEVAPEILEVAPYLVRVDQALLQWLVDTVWSEPWGIFAVTKLEPEAARRHLRKFLMVKDKSGESMYFRYYDPRVLPTFARCCNEREATIFRGAFEAFGWATTTTLPEGIFCTFTFRS